MRTALLLTALAVAACSPAVDAGETTTSIQSTTTTVGQTSTTPQVTTTTTIAPTTTTTLLPSTTTSTMVLTGNWADEPLVVAGFGALGWWNGSTWIRSEEEGALPVLGGEDYQIAVVGLQAQTTGGPQVFRCEPLFNLGVELENDAVLGEWPGPYGVAISAPWELQPHLVESFDDDGIYAAFASGLLSERGLVVPNPTIKQLFRVDLEGDGTNEVIVVAEQLVGGFLPAAGDYSIAFVRKIVEGEVQTAILGDSVVINPEGSFVVGFTVGAVADLSGDGKMEVVVDSAFFEGLGVEVWEFVNDDLGFVSVLQTGCGS